MPKKPDAIKPELIPKENPKLTVASKLIKNAQALNKENQSSSIKANTKVLIDAESIVVASSNAAVSSAIEMMAAVSIKKDTEAKQLTKPITNLTVTKKELKPVPRQRSNSGNTCNPSSSNSTPIPSNKIISHTETNIVKKTFAKMTAAFKTNKPMASAENQNTDQMKSKLHAKKSSRINSNAVPGQAVKGPVKVEHKKETLVLIESPDTGSGSNRRCSSVPRTLKEKHAIVKAGIIVPELINEENSKEKVSHQPIPPTSTVSFGEKIQNFFTSHNSLNSSSSRSRQGLAKAKIPILPLQSKIKFRILFE